MIPFNKQYKKIIQTVTKFTISLEEEEKIKDDFIEFYNASLSSKSIISRAYSSKPIHWYYDRIIEWGDRAKNYSPFKIFSKKTNDVIDDLENLNDFFTLFDLVRTLSPFITFGLAYLSTNFNEYLSKGFLLFSVFLIMINWAVEIARMNSTAILKIIDTLIFTDSTILLANGSLPDKEKLYAPYIWNRSLCDPSTITVFLFLIYFKKIMPKSYEKVKESAISFFPLYMTSIPLSNKKVSRMNFLLFYLKNRKLVK